ncbi:response regulator transcription factor [Streptomyces sp. NPDC059452]|uniref:response regulator transcription factor n=1 Tax=Streptomyces sp. NPDC059452 TaxID=3346835 RepID=UPI00369D0BA8
MIRVAVADAHAPARSGLRMILDSAPDVCVLDAFDTAENLLAKAAGLQLDVVVMDARQPGTDVLDTAIVSRIVSELGCGPVLITLNDHDTHLFGALAAGARGFLSADTDPHDLLSAVRAVASGGSWLGPKHTRRLTEEYRRIARPGPEAGPPPQAGDGQPGGRLSEREHEVLALVGEGRTNQEIAERLTLSPLTAKTYVSRIMTKLGARDRVQLALLAVGSRRTAGPVPVRAERPSLSRIPRPKASRTRMPAAVRLSAAGQVPPPPP